MVSMPGVYEELRAIHIPVIMPETVQYWNMKKSLGNCRYIYNKSGKCESFLIHIASRIKGNDKMIRSIMAHELLHTAAVEHDHGGDWIVYVYLAE